MAKYELKTKKNDASVTDFLNGIADGKKRKDSFVILELMKKHMKEEPKMWGSSIVGFGTYYYKYSTGQEGDWMKIGFSPRKQNLTIYLICGNIMESEKLKNLGKFKTGKSCLYINKLEDINLKLLEEFIKTAASSKK